MSVILILCGAFILAYCLQLKIEKLLLPWMLLLFLTVYILAIIGKLHWLPFLKVLISAALLLCFYKYAVIRKITKQRLKAPFSIGFIVFLIVSLVETVFLSTHVPMEWDDMNHWATTIRQIFMQNALPTGENTTTSYSDYPPLSALAQYFVLSDFSSFREEILFPMQNFVITSCFLPFYELMDTKKNWVTNICIGISAFLLQSILIFNGFLMLKADSYITALFLYGLICAWKFTDEDGVTISEKSIAVILCVSSLTLIKSNGIVMAAVVIGTLLVVSIFHKAKYVISTAAISGVAVMCSRYSWKWYCRSNGNESYISSAFSGIGIGNYYAVIKAFLSNHIFVFIVLLTIGITIIAIILIKKYTTLSKRRGVILLSAGIFLVIDINLRFGGFQNYFSSLTPQDNSVSYVVLHYLYAFCTWPITYVYGMEDSIAFGVTNTEAIFLALLAILCIASIASREIAARFVVIFMSLTFGGIIYIVGHASMYACMFSGSERAILSAYTRYLMMYMGGIYGITFYVLMSQFMNQSNSKARLVFVLINIGILLLAGNFPVSMLSLFSYDRIPFVSERLADRQQIEDNLPNIDKSVTQYSSCVVLTPAVTTYTQNYYRYFLTPMIIQDVVDDVTTLENYSDVLLVVDKRMEIN